MGPTSDGTVLHFVRAKGAYVNIATGARYPTEDTFRDLSTYDANTALQVGVETGQTTWSFLPGDIGPYGVVGSHGALYHFSVCDEPVADAGRRPPSDSAPRRKGPVKVLPRWIVLSS
jgi:hypothetical protein